ncbi:Transcriptional regulator of nonfermentable carbon utilization [Ceratobasidium sp. 414]|nr:Transcriptional regulator of nonfermentable carbon utilization [Ceratobasidium sp. 414]
MMDVQPPLRPRPPAPDLFDTARPVESLKKVPIAPQPPKRKRDIRASTETSRAASPAQESPAPKKKKRGIGDNCTEGHRKKAKYLLDEDELEELKRAKERNSAEQPVTPQQTQLITNGLSSAEEPPSLLPAGFSTPTDPLFNITFDPAYPFGSEAANLEYSILSAILNQQPDSANSNPSLDPSTLTNPSPLISGTDGSDPNVLHPSEPWGGLPQTLGMHYAQAQSQLPLQTPGTSTSSDSRSFLRTTESHPLPLSSNGGMQRQGSQLALPSPPTSEFSTGEIIKPRSTGQVGSGGAGWAYSDGVKKYDYTEGYHFLMAYLHDRCVAM